MIPDKAVEAAARASAAAFGEAPNKRDLEHVRLVLEAAAPFIAADAWERGWKACSDWGIYIDMGGDEPNTDNPYR